MFTIVFLLEPASPCKAGIMLLGKMLLVSILCPVKSGNATKYHQLPPIKKLRKLFVEYIITTKSIVYENRPELIRRLVL